MALIVKSTMQTSANRLICISGQEKSTGKLSTLKEPIHHTPEIFKKRRSKKTHPLEMLYIIRRNSP